MTTRATNSCDEHKDRQAATRCAGCGKPLCHECAAGHQESCKPAPGESRPIDARVNAVAAIGILIGMVCLLIEAALTYMFLPVILKNEELTLTLGVMLSALTWMVMMASSLMLIIGGAKMYDRKDWGRKATIISSMGLGAGSLWFFVQFFLPLFEAAPGSKAYIGQPYFCLSIFAIPLIYSLVAVIYLTRGRVKALFASHGRTYP
jgi:hypothetical protein